MVKLLGERSLNKYPLVQFTVKANSKDLETLAALIQEGKMNVHIDRTCQYDKIPKALTNNEDMTHRGKVAMVWYQEYFPFRQGWQAIPDNF